MYIITVIMLGGIISLGILQVWQQVTSLYETAWYCYGKEQRRHLAEAVVAYATTAYRNNQEIQKAVERFGSYEMNYEPALSLPEAQVSITYKLLNKKEVAVTATVLIQGSREIVYYKMACPEKPF